MKSTECLWFLYASSCHFNGIKVQNTSVSYIIKYYKYSTQKKLYLENKCYYKIKSKYYEI